MDPELAALLNYAPEFKEEIESDHTFVVKGGPRPKLKYRINIPEITDDYDLLSEVVILSDKLGDAKWTV